MFLFKRRTTRHVILYTRSGCHLCEDALSLLQRLSRRHRLIVDEVDITEDPALVRRYDLLIPVIVIGDTELTAPIRERDLRAALDRDSSGATD